ncbi:MAG: phage holin family protein [Traorella sp.]
MKKGFTGFVLQFILAAGVIMLMGYIFEGVYVKDFYVAFVVAIVLSLLNKFIKPIIKFFTLPLNILTLGIFGFIVNGLILQICCALLAPDFQIASFGLSIIVAICISILYSILGIDK